MRKINVSNPEELKQFKMEITGFMSSYGFPYRLDDFTGRGANYTVFCPLRWKSAFSPAKLHKLLRGDVDADVIKVEYIDFVKEETVKPPRIDEFENLNDFLKAAQRYNRYQQKSKDCVSCFHPNIQWQRMKRQDAKEQYCAEVSLFEQYGSINTTTFEEWLEIKNIKLED